MSKGMSWLLLLTIAITPSFGDAPKAKEEATKWQVKTLTPTIVERPRIGYVLVQAEQERTVCKACRVCTKCNDGKNCCLYCQTQWMPYKEKYLVPALVLQDLEPLQILSTEIQTLDVPPDAKYAAAPKKAAK